MTKSNEMGGGTAAKASKTASGNSSIQVNLTIATDENKIMTVVNNNIGSLADKISNRLGLGLFRFFGNSSTKSVPKP